MMNLIPNHRLTHPIFDEFDRFFGRALAPVEPSDTRIHEADDAWHLSLDLPGFTREEIDLQVADGMLRLKAETQDEERAFRGTVEHRFSLPEDAEAANISAKFENGVLTLRVPKRPKEEPEVRRIEVQ